MSSVMLGTDVETGEVVRLGDVERRSGLYILGKPGMGKSVLMVNMQIQDIVNGHGLFFLDPHGDAIVDLLRRTKGTSILLDPEDDEYSFGINLLSCPNVSSLRVRTETYTKAYNVFYKLWEDQWGVWLQLILQNILWAFIENQDYTLADVPMFLNPRNEDFRNHIIGNIQYNSPVADFWRYEFFSRREQDQQERVDAALTRINTLLTHPYVRHIIGQQKTAIDFENALSKQKIILVRLSANLAEDIKKFIGTILISELLHAVRARPEGDRDQFCIFVDEFQNFSSADDFRQLLTEGRKFGVATTIAHQERFGQFADNERMMGATLAAANKVVFQATVKDAEELAPEFAKTVEATEKRREAELVISPRPVEDIWERGHPEKWLSYARQQYFWLVDLLRKHANDAYLTFDTVRIPSYDPKVIKLNMPKWDEYDDWEMYRVTPQMLETGIRLLNQYYYDCMQKKYTVKKPAPDTKIELALQIVECFAGVLGLRPSMIPYIPETMRLSIVKRTQEMREREIENQQRSNDELRRLGLQHRIPRVSYGTPAITLSELPTNLHVQNIPLWKKNALHVGFSTHEIEQFIQWKVRPYVPFERERLRALIEDALNENCDNSTLNIQYQSIMLHEFFERKNIDIDTLIPGSPLMNAVTHRIVWQLAALQLLTVILFNFVPKSLQKQPVKIPSTKYDESLRVERPQHDLVTDMVLELSRLPRFEAYAKLIDESQGRQVVKTHRIQTYPLPASNTDTQSKAIANGHGLAKKRTEIEAEIRERQSRWGRGGSPPPQTRRVR